MQRVNNSALKGAGQGKRQVEKKKSLNQLSQWSPTPLPLSPEMEYRRYSLPSFFCAKFNKNDCFHATNCCYDASKNFEQILSFTAY